jgi:hypothetical protein
MLLATNAAGLIHAQTDLTGFGSSKFQKAMARSASLTSS